MGMITFKLSQASLLLKQLNNCSFAETATITGNLQIMLKYFPFLQYATLLCESLKYHDAKIIAGKLNIKV